MDMDHTVANRSLLSNAQLGLLLSSALWGIASLQAVTYYRNFKSDMILMKVAVCSPKLESICLLRIDFNCAGWRCMVCTNISVMGQFTVMNERLADTMYVIISAIIQIQIMHGTFSLLLIPAVLVFAAVMQTVVQVGLTLIHTTGTAQERYRWYMLSDCIV
jgi:hypothetical protein